MERVRGFIIPVLIVATLALTAVAEKENKTEGIIGGLRDELTPRPVCVSQMALANYACSMIPYSPLPPPAPPTAEEGDSSHHNRHRRHGHRHRHHSGPLSQEEEDCCRWLYEIDTDCVCEMLVRLPDFLSRPVHRYTLVVGDSCNVTYTCGGRVIR